MSLGIPLHLTHHSVAHTTLSPVSSAWPSDKLFAHNSKLERALTRHDLYAIQIGPTWRDRAIPAMQLTPDRLILGVGTSLVVHPLLHPGRRFAGKTVGGAKEYRISTGGSEADVVGVHELPGGSVAVAQFDGTLQRLELSPAKGDHTMKSTAHYVHPKGSNIHVLAGCGDMLLTASSGGSRASSPSSMTLPGNARPAGTVRLWRASSPWLPPTQLQLPTPRAWSALLTDSRAFLGLNGGIHVHALAPSGMQRTAVLHGVQPQHSAAYGLVQPPFKSSVGSSDHTLLSAWHDGVARLHDLRTGSAPVLELSDPWSDAGLYSCAFVGAHGVAAGGAQHGQVSVWDVRSPRSSGWSLFSPGGRGSPVYALAGEGGRVWGVTEKRAFVLAFDGSGDVPGGLATPAARAPPPVKGAKDVPSGWKRRGGRMNWTVHFGEHAAKEVTMGYRHGDRGMALFESRVPA